MDIERAHNWFALEQGAQSFANTVVLLPLITLVVLSRLPKADRQDTIRFYGYVCWIGFWHIRSTAGPERLFMVGWFAGFVLSPLHTLWATSESEPMPT